MRGRYRSAIAWKEQPVSSESTLAHGLLADSPKTGEIAMRIARLIVGSLALALTMNAASATDLRIALRDDPDALDPTLATTYTGRVVFAGLCDKLFDIDQHLNIVPQLATGYEWSDTHTLLVHLRQGVKFQDGTTMDADAVKTSL
jgi:peptide/nickel transport system substrate-binding protein